MAGSVKKYDGGVDIIKLCRDKTMKCLELFIYRGAFCLGLMLCTSLGFCLFQAPCLADGSNGNDRIAVVISKKIKPYIQVGDGIQAKSEEIKLDVDLFILDPETKSIQDNVLHQLALRDYKLIAAIGPEAAVFIWAITSIHSPKVYTAILDPENCTGLPEHAMGIALKIPVEIQVKEISRHFENLGTIGVLFDPTFNQDFYDQAEAAALNHSFETTPIKVGSKTQISQQLQAHIGKIDAIWMIPDQTVISEKIVHYVIKQGIYQGMGVIGYNSFFTLSGAFFSFEFDYKALGSQAALKIKSFLESGQWTPDPPLFKTIVNQRMAKKLGIIVKK